MASCVSNSTAVASFTLSRSSSPSGHALGLMAGDVITTGTTDGVAFHHKLDPAPWFLEPGDLVEAGVDSLGTLTTFIK